MTDSPLGFSYSVTGGEAVVARLNSFSPRMMAALGETVTRLTVALQRKVKEEKLSGQVLKNRTGTLRRSIHMNVTRTTESVTGRVDTNLSYAAAHEFGFDGVVNVRAHMRMMTQAFGLPVREPRQIEVGAHSRHMVLPERSFLRSALREMVPEVEREITATVNRIAGEGA